MNTYKLHWRDGKTEIVQGDSISQAFASAGYGNAAIRALNYYEELYEELDDDPKEIT